MDPPAPAVPSLAASLLVALLLGACGSEPAPPRDPVRLTIVGIDGASWKVIDPMIERGRLPRIASLIRRGVRADLHSQKPLMSPPIWTTIATGVPRRRHGIRAFLGRSLKLVSSTERRVPALWNLASRAGRRTAVLGWWATYPAEAIDGVVISERAFKTRQRSIRRVLPARVVADTESSHLTHPVAALGTVGAFLGAAPAGGADVDASDVVGTMRLEDAAGVHALLALRESDGLFDLEMVLLRGVDPVSHHFWQYHEPDAPAYTDADRPTADDLDRVGDPVEDHYAFVDALIGELLEASAPDRAVLLVSDHGFEAGYQSLRGGERLLGTHSSDAAAVGILVAAGGPFARGVRASETSILDVTPTVLRALDLPIADDLPGRVVEEAFEPTWLARHAPKRVERYVGPPQDVAAGDTDTPSPGDAALIRELRSLGYIE